MKSTITGAILAAAVIFFISANSSGEAAKQKKTALKPSAVKKKAEIPLTRIAKEFKDVYKVQPGTTIVKLDPTGKSRRYTIERGGRQTPALSCQVSLVLRLTECGINVREIWEVNYFKLETEWIFQDIIRINSVPITKTKKKEPGLDDTEAKKIISEALKDKYQGAMVEEITILSKKSAWDLCIPEYIVRSKIALSFKNEIYQTLTDYECIFSSTLAYRDGTWKHDRIGCEYKGKDVPDCHIGTMCRELSVKSSIPAISDDAALKMLKASFEHEYGLKKKNVSVEKFDILSKGKPVDYGKKSTFVLHALFVIDENKEVSDAADRTYRTVKVRAVYECIVYGYLLYSAEKNIWEAIIESCCPSEKEPCGLSCSDPVKGCTRLGEK